MKRWAREFISGPVERTLYGRPGDQKEQQGMLAGKGHTENTDKDCKNALSRKKEHYDPGNNKEYTYHITKYHQDHPNRAQT